MSGEAVTVGGSALLAIENAGDHGVGVMDSEATHQRDGVFISAHGCGTALQVEINLGMLLPRQRRVRCARRCSLSRAMMTSSSRVRSSSFLSRGAVVGACQ